MQRFRFLIPMFVLPMLIFPLIAGAQKTQSGLVVCGNGTAANAASEQCAFEDLIKEVQVVINFLIFKIAAPLAAVMFAYAGFLYVTNGGNESRIKEAHEIFWNVFIGLIVALAAWMVVSFILSFFLGENSAFNFLK